MAELVLEPGGSLNVDSVYSPWPKQEQLHASSAPNLLAIGGNGSGKSAFLIGEALYNALEYPGSHCLLLRKTFRELEKGLIQDFQNTVPRELYRYNDSKHIATFHNDAKVFFGHCSGKSGGESEKNLAQYLSAAFIWIGIDELGQFSYEAWNFLSSRNRVNKGCRPNPQGLMPYCRMGGATNPLGPGYGWIKKLWVDHRPVSQLGKTYRKEDGAYYSETHGGEIEVFDPKKYFFVHSTVLDNPSMLERDPGYIERLKTLAPALRQKALYGDLNAIAGVYFQNFLRDRHVLEIPRDSHRIQWEPWQPVWLGIDWGLAHHSVIYWNTRAKVLSLDGKKWRNIVVTTRELFVKEMSLKDLCKEIGANTPEDERKRIRHIFLSPERFARTTDPDSRHTVANEMGIEFKKIGLPSPMRANDRRVDGAVFMYNLLDADEWMILDTCPELISALETRVRDEKNLEDVLKVNDLGDDAYDGSRYAMLSMLSEKGKPEELKYQERLAKIEDPMAARLFAYEHWLKEQERKSKGDAIRPKFATRLTTK